MTILELVWGAIWFFPEKIYERFGKLGCFIFFLPIFIGIGVMIINFT